MEMSGVARVLHLSFFLMTFTAINIAAIANQLRLETLLPRLQGAKILVTTIMFPPYQCNEIFEILNEKFGSTIVSPTLQFVSRKVAAQSGDLRIALDICQ